MRADVVNGLNEMTPVICRTELNQTYERTTVPLKRRSYNRATISTRLCDRSHSKYEFNYIACAIKSLSRCRECKHCFCIPNGFNRGSTWIFPNIQFRIVFVGLANAFASELNNSLFEHAQHCTDSFVLISRICPRFSLDKSLCRWTFGYQSHIFWFVSKKYRSSQIVWLFISRRGAANKFRHLLMLRNPLWWMTAQNVKSATKQNQNWTYYRRNFIVSIEWIGAIEIRLQFLRPLDILSVARNIAKSFEIV